MSSSENRYGTVTHTSSPAPRNDRPLSSSANMFRTGTVSESFPPPHNTAMLRTGSPAQRSNEPRTPLGSLLGHQPSGLSSEAARASPTATFGQQGDWGNPVFIEGKITELERAVGRVTGRAESVAKESASNTFSNITALATKFKAEMEDKATNIPVLVREDIIESRKAFREEMLADGKTFCKKMEADMKAAVDRNVKETLGAMSVSVEQLNGNVDALGKDVRALKKAVQRVQPTLTGVAADLNTSLAHAEQQLGHPVAHQDVHDSILGAFSTISTHDRAAQSGPPTANDASSTPNIPSADAGVAQTGAVQEGPDVPTTPTIPGTPSVDDTPSVSGSQTSSVGQARHYIEVMRSMAKFYNLMTFKKKRTYVSAHCVEDSNAVTSGARQAQRVITGLFGIWLTYVTSKHAPELGASEKSQVERVPASRFKEDFSLAWN
ncbi:hypothetical protein LXA43DRAFT_1064239 [Ganoderma leucocontextum]|nr:hypothetical protein LXA43DRAFT_1064239 [Ganoderma leucocontextum]